MYLQTQCWWCTVIDFILSKMGILLFAVTMAGLLLFFADNIKNVFLADETIQISNVLAKQIKYMAESENTCASTKVILPKYIDIYGVSSDSSTSSIYYYLDISKIPQDNGDSFIVFTIVNKKNNKTIALESFRTKANTYFELGGTPTSPITSATENNIKIDPTDLEVIYMVKSKKVVGVEPDAKIETDIYFVNCDYKTEFTSVVGQSGQSNKSAFQSCFTALQNLNKELAGSNYPFFCVPNPVS